MDPFFHMFFQQNRFMQNELNETLKEHGLYSAQWSVLWTLHTYGPMSLTMIWRYLHVEAPTITRTVARLEVLGLVQKMTSDDKREKLVMLSDVAKEKMPAIIESVEQFEQKMKQHLTEEELVQLTQLLQKMKG